MRTTDLKVLRKFPKHREQLGILERSPLKGSELFFRKLMRTPLKLIGKVSKRSSIEDVQYILEKGIPKELQTDPFYRHWVADMSQVSETFCHTLRDDAIGFCISTKRGCHRYHIDNVPMRLLVTYAGQGTEWLPEEAVDRKKPLNGATNREAIKHPATHQFINCWDIAIFHGGPNGLLHRTPDSALNGPSLLLRLDPVSFWDNILIEQGNNFIQNKNVYYNDSTNS